MVVYFTIINTSEYLDTDSFSWTDAINMVSEKLEPYYRACCATYCSNINNFKNAYDTVPIFVPVDGNAETISGQLFLLVDIVNSPEDIPEMCTMVPFLQENSHSDDDMSEYSDFDYWDNYDIRVREERDYHAANDY